MVPIEYDENGLPIVPVIDEGESTDEEDNLYDN